jgi:hypothetical protein
VKFDIYKKELHLQDFLYRAGDYVILAYTSPLENAKSITSLNEDIENKGIGTILRKEFRYSFDNETFSEFIELSLDKLNEIVFVENSNLWFQFRATLFSGGPSMIKSISLDYETFSNDIVVVPPPGQQNQSRPAAYPVTYKTGAKWNPYQMGKAVRLYKDLNLMVNSLFGHEVLYYRALPQGRSKDVFLLEYSLYEHEDKQCIKVVVPNNQFPDNKLNMGMFGVDFEMPFEIQIDKDYFQAIYGEGTGPQKRDVIYFPRTNRIYEVSSSYLFRDFMNEPLYFKATLIKWQPKANAEQSLDLNALEDLAPSVEKLFGVEQEEQKVDIANPTQFVPSTTHEDPVREYVSVSVEISDNPLLNYYLTVAEYQYNLQKSVAENLATVKLNAINKSKLTVGSTYYARFNRSGTFLNENYYFSMKKVKYLGDDQNGNLILSFSGGESVLEKDHGKGTIFTSGSQFYLYASEYVSSNTSEEPLFSCALATTQSYQEKAVKYKALGDFPQTQDRAISAWFRLRTSEKFSCNVSSFTVNESDYEVTVSLAVPHDFFIGDWLSLRRSTGGNFDLLGQIVSITDSKNVTISVPPEIFKYLNTVFANWKTYSNLRVKLTYPNVFIDNMKDGKGIKIDLLGKRFFRVFANEKVHFFSLPNTQNDLSENKWYNITTSISNLFSQLTLNIWDIQWDQATNTPATSDLRLVFGKTETIAKIDRSSTYNYFLVPSEMDLTNIRVWNQKIETDKQPFVLNQNIVKDASRALVIDNAIPQSKLPYISYTH